MYENSVKKQDIIDGLRKLGLKSGDHTIVHSSLKSLGHVEGGADAVIDAVIETVGFDGTMLVPTNVFSGSVTEFLRSNRAIDMRTAPSLKGVITETLRKRPGALRSIHPSHPVAAIGYKAAELLSEHHLDNSPAGAKSPYGKLAQLDNGRILLLGVTNSNNTTIHTAEEYYTPYIFADEIFDTEVTALDGCIYNVKVRGYCKDMPRNFTALDGKLVCNGIMKSVRIGAAAVTLVESKGMLEVMKEECSKNPFILTRRMLL
jgi:Aminoglycoside N3''-acetyltransferase